MSGLEEVLAAHEWTWRVFQQRPVLMCACGDALVSYWSSRTASLDDHRAHVAAAVTAWITERLASEDVREAVRIDMREHGANDCCATAALTAVTDALREGEA